MTIKKSAELVAMAAAVVAIQPPRWLLADGGRRMERFGEEGRQAAVVARRV